MNKAKKNVVIVGFTENERHSVSFPALADPYYESQIIHYVNSLSEATKYQGYMIVIDNSDNKNIVNLDKKYRKTFNRFELVFIYNKNYDGSFLDNEEEKWSRIRKVGSEIFEEVSYELGENWNLYKEKKDHEIKKYVKYNKMKQDELKRLYDYISSYKNRKTNEIVNDLKMNKRTIQRYMHDLNEIYHNIGYDYSLNEWYFIW